MDFVAYMLINNALWAHRVCSSISLSVCRMLILFSWEASLNEIWRVGCLRSETFLSLPLTRFFTPVLTGFLLPSSSWFFPRKCFFRAPWWAQVVCTRRNLFCNQCKNKSWQDMLSVHVNVCSIRKMQGWDPTSDLWNSKSEISFQPSLHPKSLPQIPCYVLSTQNLWMNF